MLMQKIFENEQKRALSYPRQPSPAKSLPTRANDKFWEKKIGSRPGDQEDPFAMATRQGR